MRKVLNYGVFYAVWVAMIVGETYAWAIAGYMLGVIGFTIGGILLARFHECHTNVGERPFGWPLRLAAFATARNQVFGLLVNTLLNGAGGVGIVETAMGHSSRVVRLHALYVALGYSILWCTIHYARPHGVVPIYWHPSIAAVSQIWKLVAG